jgi:hypothetical protein
MRLQVFFQRTSLCTFHFLLRNKMHITCKVVNFQDTPVSGLSVTLRCLDYPRHFEGTTDQYGYITQWTNSYGDNYDKRSLCGESHWQMVFQTGEYPGCCFPEIHTDIRVDHDASFPVRLILHSEMYAIVKDAVPDANNASVHGGNRPTDFISISGIQSHAAVPENFLSIQDEEEEDSLVEILSPLPYDAISDRTVWNSNSSYVDADEGENLIQQDIAEASASLKKKPTAQPRRSERLSKRRV